ncbi:MAG: methionine--tRNA ligase [Methanocellales archaeon]
MQRKVLVTTAWPYANGPLHLGHIAGCYLPADIFVRYQRMIGSEAIMVSGTDEHGTPISVRAEVEKTTPREIVDKYYQIIAQSLEALGCSYDLFTRTTTENHYETVQAFFLKLYEKGYIYKKSMLLPFCPNCRKFLPDRYIEGKCPRCGAEGARGDQCDACGRTLDPLELIDPYCKHCSSRPVARESEHYFFKLSAFQDQLIKWVESKSSVFKPNVYTFTINWLKEGLVDRPITRDLEWGVQVPLENAKGKVIYVWFDAVIGYLSATKEYFKGSDDWKQYWQNKEAEIYYFIGKDNIPFHTIIWPAMLLAHGDLNLPSNVPANEFLNLQGSKFSTSRNYAVWLNDYLATFESDPLRYALTINMPETRDADFTWDEFQRRNNEELVSTFGNFAHRVLTFIERFFQARIPEPGEFQERDLKLFEEIKKAEREIGEFIEKFEFKRALNRLMQLATAGNQYLNEMEPWRLVKSDRKRGATVLYAAANLARALAILSAPFLPFSAEKLWHMLGYDSSVHKQSWYSTSERIALNQQLKEVKPLFRIIEREEIEREKAKLKDVRKMKEEITIEEFQKLDIRTGTILKAEPIKGSKNLLRFEVDIGEEKPRQIIGGFARNYKPEEMIGKQVAVLVNLKPAKLFGLESQGMILAAGETEPVLLVVEKKVPSGTKIK